MNEKKLTTEQIESLFDFCKKHYVPYYDLQVELVDHLASAIESKWELQPDLSFESALNKTFGAFGVSGFSSIRMEREKALLKKYRHMLWQYFGQFFKLPKILLTALLVFLIFLLFHATSNDKWLGIGYIFAVILFEVIYYAYIYPRYFKIKFIPGKTFLISNVIRNLQGSLAVLPSFLIQFINFLWNENKSR